MESKVEVTLNLTGEIARLALKPGDVLAIKLSGEYSDANTMQSIAYRVRAMLADAGHDNQVIVSDSRMEILVITPDP